MQQPTNPLWSIAKRRPSAFVAPNRSKSYPGVPDGKRVQTYPEAMIRRTVIDADRTGLEVEFPSGARYELKANGQMVRRSA